MEDRGIDEILAKLPLNETVLFDDVAVCLQIFPEGAALSTELSNKYSSSSMSSFLESGFAMTLLFDAGLGIDDGDGRLLLSQWLPSVKSWCEAEPALEKILNQRDRYFPELLINKTSTPHNSFPLREEQRIRSLLGR
ncbi:hypothetical protein [Actimicrobium sp. CCI2.3]|uniref:hypothetical protein n=1 Tax=Actimicrobium sp. CCI2.3 TaxID=3048616 RepID=UPI002AB58845|nr:hypothetical protein [Actimicrobium sp. CCI2.3]MDY7576017.1 hypothetical protein [Actimicrobium sp. CCI2.3]MEB0023330.1 hypothetical protein [Actimicrobium sp. CCI2.3]